MKSFVLICLIFLFSTCNLAAQVVATPDAPLDEPKIFTFVDQQPSFPGGNQAFNKFLTTYLRVPKEVRKGQVSGKVVAQFIIGKAGQIEDVNIVQSLSPACDKAVISVLKKAPRFSPAIQNNKPVKFRYTLPVYFAR